MNLADLRRFLALIIAGFLCAPCASAQEPKQQSLLVIISVDGMRPDYVTAADAHGAKIPNLRRFVKEGAFAEGVQGVIPTVTYPSHTTIVTGVWPGKHGIFANESFDPWRKNYEGWYWYSEDIRVPTLWDVAANAGLTTASIQWPATVGANITWNIPEIWRAGTAEDDKLIRVVATPGLLAELQPQLAPFRGGIDTSVEADEVRGRYAIGLLEKKRPNLLLLHLTALDHIEHETGPFSPESLAVLERLDGVIGSLLAAAQRTAPGRGWVAVVSDHGFARTDKNLNLFAAFREAGLLIVNSKGEITSWKAMPWTAGGSAAIVLKDPADTEVQERVRALLENLAGDPANGIDRILDAKLLHESGGFPPASFLVALKPGWKTVSVLTGPLVTEAKPGGTHGYLPQTPEMRSAFFLLGPGVPAGRSLGIIDMRDIAPTLGARLGLSLPDADGKNLLPK